MITTKTILTNVTNTATATEEHDARVNAELSKIAGSNNVEINTTLHRAVIEGRRDMLITSIHVFAQ